MTRIVVGIVAGALLFIGSLGAIYSAINEDDEAPVVLLPDVGDHWHARYSVEIDGVDQPFFPESGGDVHSHGDGLVHIHPHSPATAYDAATLSAFFTSLGGTLTDDTLGLPDGRTFDHDHIEIFVDGALLTNWSSYVPQDGDQITISITTGGR